MSDFEMLSIVLIILSIVVTILIAYINQSKKQPPSAKGIRLLFCNFIKFGSTNYQ